MGSFITQSESDKLLDAKINQWARNILDKCNNHGCIVNEDENSYGHTVLVFGGYGYRYGKETFNVQKARLCDKFSVEFLSAREYQISDITWDSDPEHILVTCYEGNKEKGKFSIAYYDLRKFLVELFAIEISPDNS